MTTTTKTTSKTTSRTTATTGTAPARLRPRGRAVVAAAAVAAALGVWLVAVPLLGVDLQVQPNGGPAQAVGAGQVVAASLTAALLGWAVLALLERRTARALTVWTLGAVAVLLLSLAAPLTAARTASAGIVLVTLHLTVAAVLIVGLRRTSPSSGTASAA
jgi:hypothetical protein